MPQGLDLANEVPRLARMGMGMSDDSTAMLISISAIRNFRRVKRAILLKRNVP